MDRLQDEAGQYQFEEWVVNERQEEAIQAARHAKAAAAPYLLSI